MAYLILADGTVFAGSAIGAKGETIGETVFTTGMTGYLETLTDPSYFGQIVTQTFPLIGNYGLISEDFESKKSWVQGYIVRELCEKPSNFRSQGDLDSFLKSQNIIGISGIDTRELTKKLRESGVMNGMITSADICPQITESLLTKIKNYKICNAVESVSCKCTPTSLHADISAHVSAPHIVLWDFGAKKNIQRELEKRGAKVTVVPYSYTAQDIIELQPDGVMLSNGPGDPQDNTSVISEISKLCDYDRAHTSKPVVIFGICLGHQMLALANGAQTTKLKYGHRGANHPVKDTATQHIYISSQNHGYAVKNESLPVNANLAFVNCNDGTCEGISYTDIPAFSVQFHPEACGGPHDTNFLFDKFLEMIKH